VLGTLFCFDRVIDTLHMTFPNDLPTKKQARIFYYGWLWAGIRDYFGTSHAGRYHPLLFILRGTLTRARLVQDMETPTNEEIDQIMAAFEDLEPMATALECFELLRENNWDIWILTNGSYASTELLLKRHGLDTFVGDNILSCDDLGISKPHPKVYSEFMRAAVHKTKRIEVGFFVAAHAWDLAGAKNVSVRTVYLTTEEKVYSADAYDGSYPDVQSDSLIKCVKGMIELENKKRRFL
ncbi:HAD-like domain-containing protein, partial [Phycomyces nitens]